ncbi:MAG: hypothetical protein E7621_01175 [Ruminococcaceae bacterium]|nr:hypothetical protein [Oscillospiraceae bacterium]
MKKKFLFALFCALFICLLCFSASAAELNVNGETKHLAAYNIKGNNYFKLRDIAHILNGTEAQFDVQWDEDRKAITLFSATPYSSSEVLNPETVPNAVALANNSPIYMDKVRIILGAYNIEGNNYFKLRDLAAMLDVGITYDPATKIIGIDTTAKYEFPDAGTAFGINPEFVSLVGKKVDSLEAKYGERTPDFVDYYGIERSAKFSNGIDVSYALPGTTKQISSVSLPLSLLFNNCPEAVTVDMLKGLFIEWKIIVSEGQQYFKGNLHGGTVEINITEGTLTPASKGYVYADEYSNESLMTEVVYVGREYMNTVNIKPRWYYRQFLTNKVAAGELGAYDYTYNLVDITGDGIEELLCLDYFMNNPSRVYTIRNGEVFFLYQLSENEHFGYFSSPERYGNPIECITETISGGDYGIAQANLYTLTNDGAKVLIASYDFVYNEEYYASDIYVNGKKLEMYSEAYEYAQRNAIFNGHMQFGMEYDDV